MLVNRKASRPGRGTPPILVTILVIAVAFFAVTQFANTFKKGTPSVGQIAPDISGVDRDGKQFQLSDYRGKVVMLDFWGNW